MRSKLDCEERVSRCEGAEMWTLKKDKKRLEALEMKIWRSIEKISWMEKLIVKRRSKEGVNKE